MNLFVPIEELRNQVNLTQLTAAQSDDELISYCLAAQKFAEAYCKRYFDGTVSRTQYFSSSESGLKLVARAYPILAVTTLKVDSSLAFDAGSAISSADYFIQSDNGIIKKISGYFADPYSTTMSGQPAGTDDIQLVYKGGFIPEQIITPEETPKADHTINSQAVFLSQAFQIWVQTRVANAAGNVLITGTDENGAAQTETITFQATTATVTGYRKASKLSWRSVTAVNGSGINTSGALLRITATSFPDTLRQALAMHAGHLYIQDSTRSLNVGSRNVEGDSESAFVKGVPQECMAMYNSFRNYQ